MFSPPYGLNGDALIASQGHTRRNDAPVYYTSNLDEIKHYFSFSSWALWFSLMI